ncbi:hypothetical protein KDAU_42870 [Dictyobacter aurantiacus]|uniref:Uncharacterized protein n=1 Tax=Dictyobacter aurantiacus TaxID=1936993 RepID=A0A401ZJF5_9CHLR|nr:hypothetical protein KDAU_42870 [Dictyobacter aurantiacus]
MLVHAGRIRALHAPTYKTGAAAHADARAGALMCPTMARIKPGLGKKIVTSYVAKRGNMASSYLLVPGAYLTGRS